VEIRDIGIQEYESVLNTQKDLVAERRLGKIPNTLIMAQHLPVVVFGRSRDEKNVINKKFFDEKNVPFFFAGRGGRITYHAPGQLVLYPIIDLKEARRDIAFYIDFLEKVIVKSLRRIGIPARRGEDRRGVWVSGRKIAFIGISLKNWVTYHGAAININNDITPFSHINPCGEEHIKVTSAAEYAGRKFDMDMVKEIFAEEFVRNFEIEYMSLKEKIKS